MYPLQAWWHISHSIVCQLGASLIIVRLYAFLYTWWERWVFKHIAIVMFGRLALWTLSHFNFLYYLAFVDYLNLLLTHFLMRWHCNEILGMMMDKEIDRWKVIQKIGRVHRLSGFSVSHTTSKDKEIADNNLKLFFTHKTHLLNVLDEYNAIPWHHLPPFSHFVDVSTYLQTMIL